MTPTSKRFVRHVVFSNGTTIFQGIGELTTKEPAAFLPFVMTSRWLCRVKVSQLSWTPLSSLPPQRGGCHGHQREIVLLSPIYNTALKAFERSDVHAERASFLQCSQVARPFFEGSVSRLTNEHTPLLPSMMHSCCFAEPNLSLSPLVFFFSPLPARCHLTDLPENKSSCEQAFRKAQNTLSMCSQLSWPRNVERFGSIHDEMSFCSIVGLTVDLALRCLPCILHHRVICLRLEKLMFIPMMLRV